MGSPVDEALTKAWEVLGDRESLMPDLDADAVVARATTGELSEAAPRLVELAVAGASGRESVHSLIGMLTPLLVERGRTRDVVIGALDAWWETTLALDPDPAGQGPSSTTAAPARKVLRALVELDEPLVRWLEPWLVDLDGAPARHLAELVTNQLVDDEWDLVPDKREQVLAWAASEPVVFGLTLVGGVHLGEGELSDVLDLLL